MEMIVKTNSKRELNALVRLDRMFIELINKRYESTSFELDHLIWLLRIEIDQYLQIDVRINDKKNKCKHKVKMISGKLVCEKCKLIIKGLKLTAKGEALLQAKEAQNK